MFPTARFRAWWTIWWANFLTRVLLFLLELSSRSKRNRVHRRTLPLQAFPVCQKKRLVQVEQYGQKFRGRNVECTSQCLIFGCHVSLVLFLGFCCFCWNFDVEDECCLLFGILDNQVGLQIPKTLLFDDGIICRYTCFNEIPRLVVSAY